MMEGRHTVLVPDEELGGGQIDSENSFKYMLFYSTDLDGSECPFAHTSRSCMERFEDTNFNRMMENM